MHLNPYLEGLSSYYQLGVPREPTLNAEIVEVRMAALTALCNGATEKF